MAPKKNAQKKETPTNRLSGLWKYQAEDRGEVEKVGGRLRGEPPSVPRR